MFDGEVCCGSVCCWLGHTPLETYCTYVRL